MAWRHRTEQYALGAGGDKRRIAAKIPRLWQTAPRRCEQSQCGNEQRVVAGVERCNSARASARCLVRMPTWIGGKKLYLMFGFLFLILLVVLLIAWAWHRSYLRWRTNNGRQWRHSPIRNASNELASCIRCLTLCCRKSATARAMVVWKHCSINWCRLAFRLMTFASVMTAKYEQ